MSRHNAPMEWIAAALAKQLQTMHTPANHDEQLTAQRQALLWVAAREYFARLNAAVAAVVQTHNAENLARVQLAQSRNVFEANKIVVVAVTGPPFHKWAGFDLDEIGARLSATYVTLAGANDPRRLAHRIEYRLDVSLENELRIDGAVTSPEAIARALFEPWLEQL